MTQEKETAAERIARMKREKEEAQSKAQTRTVKTDLVTQLTHETESAPDFSDLATKLEARKAQEARGENEGHVKMTIYVEENLARSFNALITRRGQQKEFVNQAMRDFVQKKARELGM